jgi:demethylspheroidene O-methyltransferase
MPGGADLATLIRVLHDHDDEDAQAILHGAFAALPPGGTLLIAEPMSGQKGAEAMADAYFGFYLLAMGSGRARRPEEIRAMLETAGFGGIRTLAMPRALLASAMVARKPA